MTSLKLALFGRLVFLSAPATFAQTADEAAIKKVISATDHTNILLFEYTHFT